MYSILSILILFYQECIHFRYINFNIHQVHKSSSMSFSKAIYSYNYPSNEDRALTSPQKISLNFAVIPPNHIVHRKPQTCCYYSLFCLPQNFIQLKSLCLGSTFSIIFLRSMPVVCICNSFKLLICLYFLKIFLIWTIFKVFTIITVLL